MVDDKVCRGNEEIVHSCKGCADEVLALAGAGFRDHLQRRAGFLVRAHPSGGAGNLETRPPADRLLERYDGAAIALGRGWGQWKLL